jgi:hypothetical protein
MQKIRTKQLKGLQFGLEAEIIEQVVKTGISQSLYLHQI